MERLSNLALINFEDTSIWILKITINPIVVLKGGVSSFVLPAACWVTVFFVSRKSHAKWYYCKGAANLAHQIQNSLLGILKNYFFTINQFR